MLQKPNLKDRDGLELDRRVWAYDEDRRIAEIALKGRLEGEWEWKVLIPAVLNAKGFLVDNIDHPLFQEIVSENFCNEEIEIFENLDRGWTYARTKADSYFGFVQTSNIIHPLVKLETRCQALRGHQYKNDSVREFLGATISFQDRFDAERYSNDWYILADERDSFFVHKSALEPSTLPPLEWVKQFLGTPYLWGGRTAWGIDCSGLAQMYFRYQDIYIPRDADQQEAAFAKVENPRAGDLAFFEGHVGILLEQSESGNWRMLHANSRHMSVTVDTLNEGDYGQHLSSILHGYGRWDGEIGVYWKPR